MKSIEKQKVFLRLTTYFLGILQTAGWTLTPFRQGKSCCATKLLVAGHLNRQHIHTLMFQKTGQGFLLHAPGEPAIDGLPGTVALTILLITV